MDKTHIYPLFSKPLYVSQVDYEFHKIIPKINNYNWAKSKQADKGVKETFSEITKDFFVLNDIEFIDLRKEIEKHFYNYVHEILKWDQKFKLTTSWFTKTIKNQSIHLHNHNNCMYSGVVYIKTPKEKASITFENLETKRFLLSNKETNIYNATSFTLHASEKTIVIFPSEVFHQIDMNKSNEERISLAFNFMPTGDVNSKYQDSYCEIV